jgi:glutamine amidotransferase
MSETARSQEVDVVDVATCNLGSVLRMLNRIGLRVRVLDGPPTAAASNPLVLPGVGNFAKVVERPQWVQWKCWLSEAHRRDLAILGICLGAQLMCRSSEEGPGCGLGWLDAEVRRFPTSTSDGTRVRVPHIGWREFTPGTGHLPFDVVAGRMYYAHSYFIDPPATWQSAPCRSVYGGIQFASVVRSRNAIGVQFHPEKSHDFGRAFVAAWATWARAAS